MSDDAPHLSDEQAVSILRLVAEHLDTTDPVRVSAPSLRPPA